MEIKASVIIPTYNSKRLIEACLLSFKHQVTTEVTTDMDEFEVVVLDDGSNDGTDKMISELRTTMNYELKYRYKPRGILSSRSAARNWGVQQATGEVLIFLDGDQVVSPDFIHEHIRCHKLRDDLAVIGFRKNLSEGQLDLDSLSKQFTLSSLPPIQRNEGRFQVVQNFSDNFGALETAWHLFFTCNVSVRREHFIKAGGFEEGFVKWGLEDCELGYRLYRMDLKFVYNKNICVYHLYHPSALTDEKYYGWVENLAYFKAKHPEMEVMLQEITGLYFPQKEHLLWADCYARYEYSVRALKGRWNKHEPVTIVRVSQDSAIDVLAEIEQLSAKRKLLIIDDSHNDQLDILIQCMPRSRDMQYYRGLTLEEKKSLLMQLSLSGIAEEIAL